MNGIPKFEDVLQLNFSPDEIYYVHGELSGELALGSIQNSETRIRPSNYNNHFCYAGNINAQFEIFWCSTCDKFFSKTGNLKRHLVNCIEDVKHIHPESVYELRETLFEKLGAVNTPYRDEKKWLENVAQPEIERICLRNGSYKETESTKWIREHVPISASMSSNLI